MLAVAWAIEFKLYSVIHVFWNTIIHLLKLSAQNLIENQNPNLTASMCLKFCIKVFQNTLILVVLYSMSLRIHVFDNTGFPNPLSPRAASEILVTVE
jgi:hypothetical protein